MNVNKAIKQFVSVCSIALLLGIPSASYPQDSAVEVEEIDLSQPSNEDEAEGLWDQTKQKTSEATEYSKVQGKRILDSSKEGLAKGTDAVVTGSKKAWDATKEASSKAVDYTVEKTNQAGEAISDTFNREPQDDVPVTERNTDTSQTN
jgi:hypothetical protein